MNYSVPEGTCSEGVFAWEQAPAELAEQGFSYGTVGSDVDDISGVIKIGVFVVLRRIDKKRVVIKVLQRIITCIV